MDNLSTLKSKSRGFHSDFEYHIDFLRIIIYNKTTGKTV